MAGHKFDELARSERYFVGTLFSHLLMVDNFWGLKQIFKHIYSKETINSIIENYEFEIVSELDALRDGAIKDADIKALYREFRRIAVPDIFLRWANLCIVIEAKFFTNPAIDTLENQINLQREAISKVKMHTAYSEYAFEFIALTIHQKKSPTFNSISWETALALLDNKDNSSKDYSYAKSTLHCAVERAKDELKQSSKIRYENIKFHQMMNEISSLIDQGKIYIGFTGGVPALSITTLAELENRINYKISDICWSDNWISLDVFLRRVFELRGMFKQYDNSTDI